MQGSTKMYPQPEKTKTEAESTGEHAKLLRKFQDKNHERKHEARNDLKSYVRGHLKPRSGVPYGASEILQALYTQIMGQYDVRIP